MTKQQEKAVEPDFAKVLNAIERTGFPLEHRTATAFAERGWSVVANKYYVDDNTGEAREIDLIAYKTAKLETVTVYSAVIVSCKKTSDNTWAFLSRPLNPNDPNKELTPVHFWTNDKALSYSMTRTGFATSYTERLAKSAGLTWGMPENEVFAFQELCPSRSGNGDITGYKLGNDRAIFSSITTLMKAQAYELSRLPERKGRTPAVYVFSLLSVMDGALLDVAYGGEEPEVSEKDAFKYIAHYIISRKEQFCRINFVHPRLFDEVIKEYDSAHRASVAFIKKTMTDFFEEVLNDKAKRDVFVEAVLRQVKPWVNIFGKLTGDQRMEVGNSSIEYDADTNTVRFLIGSTAPESVIECLNHVDKLTDRAKAIIKSIYRKEVNVKFEHDIPF